MSSDTSLRLKRFLLPARRLPRTRKKRRVRNRRNLAKQQDVRSVGDARGEGRNGGPESTPAKMLAIGQLAGGIAHDLIIF